MVSNFFFSEEEMANYLKSIGTDLLTQTKEGKDMEEKIFKTWANPNESFEHAKKSLSVKDELGEKEKPNFRIEPFSMMLQIKDILGKIANGEKTDPKITAEVSIALEGLNIMTLKAAQKVAPEASYCKYEEMCTPTSPKVSNATVAGIAKKEYANRTGYFKAYDCRNVHICDVFIGSDNEIIAYPNEIAFGKRVN